MKFFKASNDIMFKSIFCKESNRDLLEEIIKEVTKKKVEITELKVPEQIKKNIHVKGKTLDVIAKSDGEETNIEVNTSFYEGLHRRNAGYIFNRYVENVPISGTYNKMPKFVQINLTCSETLPLISCYTLYDKVNKKVFIDNLIIYEINLTKAKEICYNNGSGMNLISLLECNKEELDAIKGDGLVEKLKGEINKLNQDKEFVEFLTAEEEEELLTNTLKENSYNEGLNDGIEQGIEQGIITTAKNMLKLGLDIETISKATELDIDIIKSLQ